MAKDITILEGSTSKSFSNVNKLRVNNAGGGTSDWVPEDEVQLTTKHISENGTYTASDDGYYGYSEVTVSGVGGFSYTAQDGDSIGGVDMVGGNEYDISADPETGDVTVEEIPSSIAVAHQPNKTSYISGETVDTDGLVVQAYNADGSVWNNENYPNGIIPIGEITIDPTVVEIPDVTVISNISAAGTTAFLQTTGWTGRGRYFQKVNDGNAYLLLALMGPYYNLYMVSTDRDAAIMQWRENYEQGPNPWEGLGTTYYNGYYFCGGAGLSGTLITVSHSLGVFGTYSNATDLFNDVIDRIASGDISGSKTINVTWSRPSDSQVLDTNFTVRVNAATESEGETISGESGGESGSESGSGGGHSF